MATEYTWNPGTKKMDKRETKTGDDAAAAEATDKMSSTKGAGLGDLAKKLKEAKGSAASPPKGPDSPLVAASKKARSATEMANSLASKTKKGGY